MADKETITYQKPCLICGKPDYCFRLHFENGNVVHCCARQSEAAILANGEEYVQIKSKDTNIGTFFYFVSKEQQARDREEFVEQLKKTGNYTGKRKASPAQVAAKPVSTYQAKPVEGEYPVADPEKLDKVYRRFLSLLTLEADDYSSLCKDYNTEITGNFVKEKLLAYYPIKSLPVDDWVRQKNRTLKYTSPFRSEVCSKLCKEFGVLYDVPGFAEDESGVVSFIGKEGMLFPLFDKDGRIVRLRIREKYPEVRGEYKGVKGVFHHGYSKKSGQPFWNFMPEDGAESSLVWMPNMKDAIELTSKGLPKGKEASKYKNLSSVYIKEGVNGYGKGCKSGSHSALYCAGIDNFSSVYIIEGEKKAMVASLILNVPCISVPGVGAFRSLFAKEGEDGYSFSSNLIGSLLKKGMRNIVIAYDADKNSNIKVLTAEENLGKKIVAEGYKLYISEWNGHFGKGIDDAVVNGIVPALYLCS